MKHIKLLFTTHIGIILLGVILTVLGGIIAENTEDKSDIGFYTMIGGLLILLVYFCAMMFYGIKNEINNMRN
jgi:NhaP-type Na+/H+ or K+/H+ antiporter